MKKLFILCFFTLTAIGMQDGKVDLKKYNYHYAVPTQVKKLFVDIKKERRTTKLSRKSRIKVITLKGNQENNIALVAAFTKAIDGTQNLKTEWKKTPTHECDRQVRVVYVNGYCWTKTNKCQLALLKQKAEANGSLREGTKKYTKKTKQPKSILKWSGNFFGGYIEQESTYTVKRYSVPFDTVIFHLISSDYSQCPHGSYD